MKKLSFTMLLVLLLGMSLPVFAQDEDEDYDEGRDFLEVSLFGGLSAPMGGLSDWRSVNPTNGDIVELGTKTGFSAGFDIGAFVSSDLVVGVNFIYSQFDPKTDNISEDLGDQKHRFYNPSVYLKKYFFSEASLAPYVKIHAGVDNAKFVTRVFDGNIGRSIYREISYDPTFAFGGGGGIFYYTSDYSGLFLEANFHHGLSSDTEGDFQDVNYVFGESTTIIDIHAGVKLFFGTDE